MEPLAEAIRLNDSITGISVGRHQHKIGLYADDVILSLTNPVPSLRATTDILESFGRVSYYRVNPSKSQILPIGISPSLKREMRAQFPFQWGEGSITYLGISLTAPSSNLFSLNYTPLLTRVSSLLAGFSRPMLSWASRIAIVKMMVLPIILYLFRTVVIPLPNSYLTKLQKLLSDFIWEGKRARIRMRVMTRPWSGGGAGVPDVKKYYAATVLEQLRVWWGKDAGCRWLEVEESLMDLPLICLLRPKSFCPPHAPIPLLSIKASVWAWRFLTLHTPVTELAPLSALPLRYLASFLPGLSLRSWSEAGLQRVDQLFKGVQLKSFTTLMEEFRILQRDFYKYLQVRHLLQPHNVSDPVFPRLALRMWQSSVPTRGGSSAFYKLISTPSEQIKPLYLIRWETDLARIISLQEWYGAFEFVKRVSKGAAHWETACKISLRWYRTPTQLAHIDPLCSNLCWRGCGEIGTLLHMWWDCPPVLAFWTATFQLMSDLAGIDVPLSPGLALCFLDAETFPGDMAVVLGQIILAARAMIARQWKNTPCLTLSELIQHVNLAYTLEKMLACKSHRYSSFHLKWALWSDNVDRGVGLPSRGLNPSPPI